MKTTRSAIHNTPARTRRSLEACGLLLTALASGLLVSACYPKRPAPTPPTPEVMTVTVAPQPLLLTTELPGRTAPFLIAEIRPQVNGLIQKRLFTEGADVTAGQELYQIDPSSLQAAYDNAAAALGRVQANLPAIRSRAQRYKEALADKAVSQQDYDDADAAIKQAEADAQYWEATVKSARINLGYAHIVSPIAGRIGKSTVTEGAIVTAYQPASLATIQQLDPIYVDVPQSAAAALRLPQNRTEGHPIPTATNLNAVQLILDNGTTYPLEGTLQFRDVSVDPTTGSVILRMVFRNPDGVLLPGMFVRAVVREGVEEQAIMIPQQAVSRDAKGGALAMIVDASGKVEQRKLLLSRAIGDQWLVSSGLVAGDRVVVEGLQKVRPGSTVKEVPLAGGPNPGTQPANTGTAAAASK